MMRRWTPENGYESFWCKNKILISFQNEMHFVEHTGAPYHPSIGNTAYVEVRHIAYRWIAMGSQHNFPLLHFWKQKCIWKVRVCHYRCSKPTGSCVLRGAYSTDGSWWSVGREVSLLEIPRLTSSRQNYRERSIIVSFRFPRKKRKKS